MQFMQHDAESFDQFDTMRFRALQSTCRNMYRLQSRVSNSLHDLWMGNRGCTSSPVNTILNWVYDYSPTSNGVCWSLDFNKSRYNCLQTQAQFHVLFTGGILTCTQNGGVYRRVYNGDNSLYVFSRDECKLIMYTVLHHFIQSELIHIYSNHTAISRSMVEMMHSNATTARLIYNTYK
jgi:hypothetical protein